MNGTYIFIITVTESPFLSLHWLIWFYFFSSSYNGHISTLFVLSSYPKKKKNPKYHLQLKLRKYFSLTSNVLSFLSLEHTECDSFPGFWDTVHRWVGY